MQDSAALPYQTLKREYLAGDWRERSVPKISIPLVRDDAGLPLVFLNLMGALLSNGYCGWKSVTVNESTGQMDGIGALVTPSGKIVGKHRADLLTRLRCALMACLAIDQFFRGLNGLTQLKVGLIGTGAINRQTAITLSQTLGIKNVIAKGSPRNPFKNKRDFAPWVKFTDDLTDFAGCDVIITCTNSATREDQISIADIMPDVPTSMGGPLLAICQDTGWLLDDTWRRLFDSYADDPVQLQAHREGEFCFDATPPEFTAADWLGAPEFHYRNYLITGTGAVAYLYGTAIADAAVMYAWNKSVSHVRTALT